MIVGVLIVFNYIHTKKHRGKETMDKEILIQIFEEEIAHAVQPYTL